MTASTTINDIFGDLPDDEPPMRFKLSRTADGATAMRRVYRETCSKCGGDGMWHGYGDCTGDGRCTMCDGVGYKVFKTSPESRAKSRDAAAAKRNAKEAEVRAAYEAWLAANPAEAEWLREAAGRGLEFAASLLESLRTYGSFTERQEVAVRNATERSQARKAEWAAEKAARESAAPAVDAARLEQSFLKAKANGLKWPRITLGDMVIKPAGDTSKNPGALYVTESGQYLGKVMGGRFFKVRECDSAQEGIVVNLINDPVGAAEAYGHLTGHCCICNRELTNPESVARGIGPICADKFGW